MARFEYKVVPAPSKMRRIKGLKTADDRFAISVEMLMNELGAEGWEYQRAETLPCEERSGLRGRVTESLKYMLVFRRSLEEAGAQPRALLRDFSGEPPPAQMTTAAPAAQPPAPAVRGPNGGASPAPLAAARNGPAPGTQQPRFSAPGRAPLPPQPDREFNDGYSNGYADRGYSDRGQSNGYDDVGGYQDDYQPRQSYAEPNGSYYDQGNGYDDGDDYDDEYVEEYQRPVRGSARRRQSNDAPWKMVQDWEDDR